MTTDTKQQRMKMIKCPQCYQKSELPIDGWTTSLALRNLAEKHPGGIKQGKEHMYSELLQQKESTKRTVNELSVLKQQIQDSISRDEKEVQKAVVAVTAKAQDWIGQIREMRQPKLTEINHQILKLEGIISTIDGTRCDLSEMPTEHEDRFLTQIDNVTNQMAKLHEIKQSSQISSTHNELTFVANPQLGRMVQSKKLELVQEFGAFEWAYGIDSKPDGSLVVCDFRSQPKQVYAFQQDIGQVQFTQQFQFDVTREREDTVLDVAISSDGKYLMTNNCECAVDLYSSDGTCEQTTFIGAEDAVSHIISITTTSDDMIITGQGIAEDRGGSKNGSTCSLQVHNSAGNILKTIPVCINPLRIAAIRGGTHVALSNFDRNKVCVYDLQSGKQTLNLDIVMPLGITYDEQSECLLIGRMAETSDEDGRAVGVAGVIEQYCGITGTQVARLAQGLQGPFGMTLIHDGMLAVADMKTVKLYKLS